MENQEKDFQQFGKDVCSRVVTLEDSRKALVGSLSNLSFLNNGADRICAFYSVFSCILLSISKNTLCRIYIAG